MFQDILVKVQGFLCWGLDFVIRNRMFRYTAKPNRFGKAEPFADARKH